MVAVIGFAGVGCDDAEEMDDATDSPEVAVVDTGTVSAPTPDPSQNRPEAWLADRYGPESGVVELVVESETDPGRQIRYFADHGRREALYYWNTPDGTGTPHVTVVKNDSVYFRGPADPAPQVLPWNSELPIALPNFRNLNQVMKQRYSLKEIEGKRVLDRETRGYELHSGPVVSRIWVWEGIMLYGEIDGLPEKNIEPLTFRATSLDLDADIPDERFTMAN